MLIDMLKDLNNLTSSLNPDFKRRLVWKASKLSIKLSKSAEGSLDYFKALALSQ